ncbi:MAG: hypothetical protein EOO83_05300 [Oxalobacteraceae bacterium]|nr:MAG: hypothetical protein EOO83_05300 [Oxalobacteraceae bacterium]
MRIDAHQHFWRIADRTGQWPGPELEAIHRDFLPDDLRPLLDEAGVDGTVLVQTMETQADTQFMLDLADNHPFILGVVGWTDLKASDVQENIRQLASHSKLKGFRPMLQDMGDDRWIDDPALDVGIATMIEHDLVFDALVLPRHLAPLCNFARRHQELPIVIDHAQDERVVVG